MLRSVASLSAFKLSSSALAVAYSAVLAYWFGTSREMEAFFAAQTTLMMVLNISQGGRVGELVIPVYQRVKVSQGRGEAVRVFSTQLTWVFLLVLALVIPALLASRWLFLLMAPGMRDVADLGTLLTAAMLPIAALQLLASQLELLANTEALFGRPELAVNASRLVSLALVPALAPGMGIWAVVVSFAAGAVVQVGFLLRMLERRDVRVRPCLKHPELKWRDVSGWLGATTMYMLATQAYMITQSQMLSVLPQGAYAAFRYAQTLFSKVQGLLWAPVGTVFFSRFGDAVARSDPRARELVLYALGLVVLICTLASSVMVAGGDLMLAALWGGERFPAEQLRQSYLLLSALFVASYASGVGYVLRKASVVHGAGAIMYVSWTLVQVLFAVLCYVAFRTGSNVTIGIALVVANPAALAAVPLMVALRNTAVLSRGELGGRLPRWLALALAATVVSFSLRTVIDLASLPSQRIVYVAKFVIVALVVTSTTLLLARLLRFPQAKVVFLKLGRARRQPVLEPATEP